MARRPVVVRAMMRADGVSPSPNYPQQGEQGGTQPLRAQRHRDNLVPLRTLVRNAESVAGFSASSAGHSPQEDVRSLTAVVVGRSYNDAGLLYG